MKRKRLNNFELHWDTNTFARSVLNFHPDPQQAQVLNPQIARGLLNCSRQWGKSTVCAIKAVHHAYFHSNASVIIVSPSERQSFELVRKAKSFAAKLKIPLKSDGSNKASLVFPNGSRIVGFPASNDRLRGFSASLLIVDEAAHVSDALYNTVRPFLAATGGALWLMSTPNGKSGFFFDEWMSTNSEWFRISVPATDCSRISPKFLAEERARMTEDSFAREYLCQFGDSQASLFCPDDIKALFHPGVPPLFEKEPRGAGYFIPTDRNPGWSHFFVGLDLGQRRDHTAIAVLEQKTFVTNLRDPVNFATLAFCRLRLRHVEKIPLRTSYTDAIERVLEIVAAINEKPFFSQSDRFTTAVTLAIDATGVGQAIFDVIRKEQRRARGSRAQLIGINITAGAKTGYSGGLHNIPKRDLITAFQLALENKDFQIAANLPNQRELIQELTRFERRLSTAGNETFEAAHGHDDLVIALFLAVYRAFRHPPPTLRNAETIRMITRAEANLSAQDLKTLGITE